MKRTQYVREGWQVIYASLDAMATDLTTEVERTIPKGCLEDWFGANAVKYYESDCSGVSLAAIAAAYIVHKAVRALDEGASEVMVGVINVMVFRQEVTIEERPAPKKRTVGIDGVQYTVADCGACPFLQAERGYCRHPAQLPDGNGGRGRFLGHQPVVKGQPFPFCCPLKEVSE